MVSARRWILFVVLLAVSILISVLGTIYLKSPFLTLFLIFPFMPFLFGKREHAPPPERKTCPACGFATDDPLASFCPRDASRLRMGPAP